jgi:hypothetical protein
MTSALALGGHAGLRLRSRRIRSSRSHGLSPGLVVAIIVIASGVGFVGAQIKSQSEPVANAANIEQQRFAASLRPINAEIERDVAQEGLLVAAYQSGQIDRSELQRQLAVVLAGDQAAASEVAALEPPPGQSSVLKTDQEALTTLARSVTELSQAYDEGDQARVSAALALALEATARLHTLSEQASPAN